MNCAADAIRHPGIAAGKMTNKENVALQTVSHRIDKGLKKENAIELKRTR